MSDPTLRLYPPPATEVDIPYGDVDLPPAGATSSSLPYVIINMVSSLDGRVAMPEGGAARLGSALDRRTMRALRARSDAVMIGAGTLRAERLSLGLDEISSGPQPLGVVVSQSGEVPLETNLVHNEGQEILTLVPEGGASARIAAANRLYVPATSSGAVDLERALVLLRTDFAVDLLLVEGGPSLNHALISANLCDELLVTLAPKLLGGDPGGPLALLEGPALAPTRLRLLGAYLGGDELYLRYAPRNGKPAR